MNTKIAGAAIADPPTSQPHGWATPHVPAACFFHIRRRPVATPLLYPMTKLSDLARAQYLESTLENLYVLPQCYIDADTAEIERVLKGLKAADLDRQFPGAWLARAEAARTNTCNILQALIDGKRSAETKAWSQQ